MTAGIVNGDVITPYTVQGSSISTSNGATMTSPDGTNMQFAGITFDGSNIISQYSGTASFTPSLLINEVPDTFDTGPRSGHSLTIGSICFFSFSVTLGPQLISQAGTARISGLPGGSTDNNILLSSLACNITSGNQMVMDSSGNLYQQNVNGGITALEQVNFGEGSIIQGQGFSFL